LEIVNIVTIFLSSSVLAALVTVFFTRKSHQETIALKYITEERAKWREKIKETMCLLSEAVNLPKLNGERLNKTRMTSTYLKLSLNPDPNHILDKQILTCITELCSEPNYERFTVLETKISLLLKHDWERAKNEARSPISNLLLFASVMGFIWCIFYLIIRKTSIYSLIQNFHYFSGAYSEVAFSIIFIVIAIWLLIFLVNKIREYNLDRKIKILNKLLN